mmetsp:Transcript_51115/g.143943  ORF Transcript_51115/g.143943 Transcript_51115/m.143943 type:complete len:343 (-) Transcript_51115:202-1230(-)
MARGSFLGKVCSSAVRSLFVVVVIIGVVPKRPALSLGLLPLHLLQLSRLHLVEEPLLLLLAPLGGPELPLRLAPLPDFGSIIPRRVLPLGGLVLDHGGIGRDVSGALEVLVAVPVAVVELLELLDLLRVAQLVPPILAAHLLAEVPALGAELVEVALELLLLPRLLLLLQDVDVLPVLGDLREHLLITARVTGVAGLGRGLLRPVRVAEVDVALGHAEPRLGLCGLRELALHVGDVDVAELPVQVLDLLPQVGIAALLQLCQVVPRQALGGLVRRHGPVLQLVVACAPVKVDRRLEGGDVLQLLFAEHEGIVLRDGLQKLQGDLILFQGLTVRLLFELRIPG